MSHVRLMRFKIMTMSYDFISLRLNYFILIFIYIVVVVPT